MKLQPEAGRVRGRKLPEETWAVDIKRARALPADRSRKRLEAGMEEARAFACCHGNVIAGDPYELYEKAVSMTPYPRRHQFQ